MAELPKGTTMDNDSNYADCPTPLDQPLREALLAWKRISGRLIEEGDGVPGDEIDAAIALTDAALGDTNG